MALGHSLGDRTTLGRIRQGMGPAAASDDGDAYGGVGALGYGTTFGIDARGMDPRAVARLRVRYATKVDELQRKIKQLTSDNTRLQAAAAAAGVAS